jgi:hypothetical protein
VDSDSLLELGDYYADFDGSAGFYEVLNFEEVAEQLFSTDGKRQLLNTKIGNVNITKPQICIGIAFIDIKRFNGDFV